MPVITKPFLQPLDVSGYCCFETGSHYVAQVGLELRILFLQPGSVDANTSGMHPRTPLGILVLMDTQPGLSRGLLRNLQLRMCTGQKSQEKVASFRK